MSERDPEQHPDDRTGRREAWEPAGPAPVDAAAEGAAVAPTDVASGPAPGAGMADEPGSGWSALVGDTSRFAAEWDRIQTGFVDEPRRAVEQADQLVAEVIRTLTDSFSQARAHLEAQWSSGGEASTEDLRTALRRYRTFFDQLLSR